MKIQIDVDGCLADFMLGASKLVQVFDPTVPIRSNAETKDWNNWEGWSEDAKRWLWSEIPIRNFFFYSLTSLIERKDWLKLRKIMTVDNEVYFVTNRIGPSAKWQTESWLFDRLEKTPTVVITKDKAGFAKLIHSDFSIEDNASNAAKIGQIIGADRSFLIDRLYNQNLHPMSATRVKTFSEFLERVNGSPTV